MIPGLISTCDDESDSEEEQNNFIFKNGAKVIFEESQISLNEFNTLFMGMVDQLALAEIHRDVVLEFIRLILPINNIIPKSYNLIKNSIAVPEIKTFMACKLCGEEVLALKIPGKKIKKLYK